MWPTGRPNALGERGAWEEIFWGAVPNVFQLSSQRIPQNGKHLYASIGECPMFLKKIVMDQSKWPRLILGEQALSLSLANLGDFDN
jgi:hypothetical protein